ncbi:MAG: hypothetical protein JL50_03495 [Peptococcaceae bacterium BICA1-7]|nr:MAG: hypothetical protein JL50_03495 [Peptococcaceae bacterium BICA1-7]HBV97670.1 hypothetical protein [Desulfotomaculum sp.]
MKTLSVGLGGIAGALARFFFNTHLNSISLFPWGTLAVNLLGSFFLAFFLTVALRHLQQRTFVVLAVSTGFTGSFTTFSSLSVESVNLFYQSPLAGLAYIIVSLLAGLALAYGGKYAGELVSGLISSESEAEVIE